MTARTVRLYGEMGSRFGRVHRFHLDSDSPAEAVQALMSQVPGVRQYLMSAKKRGVGFTVFAGRQNLAENELTLPAAANDDDIRIAPVLMGSKKGGVLQVIVGVVLVAAAAILSFTPYAAASPYLYAAGISMIAGGVVQLLTPLPKGLHSKDSAGNMPSYSFNGPVNTQAQGNPVPLLYGGPLKVGSAVISAGIDTLETVYAQGGLTVGHMGGGGGCPELNMPVRVVRNEREVEIPACEVRAGDVLVTADPVTLAPGRAVVRYSEPKLQPCVGVVLADRSLHCSRSAPLPTPTGLSDAPDVEGLAVAALHDGEARWDRVLGVYDRGMREVQHIDIDNGCFWAGGVLHHNKQANITAQDGR